jgi:hypothetical protein
MMHAQMDETPMATLTIRYVELARKERLRVPLREAATRWRP